MLLQTWMAGTSPAMTKTNKPQHVSLARSEHEAAHQCYQQALPLYRQVGNILGEANCIKSLGDIALLRSDHIAARVQYSKALALYERIREPYSIGMTQERLARVTQGETRDRHLAAAVAAWASIGRHDLVEWLNKTK